MSSLDDQLWMGTTEAYRTLGVKRYELFRMINRGDIPAYKIARCIRLRRADVEARRRG